MINPPKTKEDAEKKTYGLPWDKRRYNHEFCVYAVWSGGRGTSSHQCYRKPGFGPCGLYCKQHAKMVNEEVLGD